VPLIRWGFFSDGKRLQPSSYRGIVAQNRRESLGVSFAFLWYNAQPAELIMGGLGAYALGATLGVMALMSGQWLVLPSVALIPAAEVVSVILQVSYFKLTQRRTGQPRRLFKMSPLHLHFQLSGWSETQVVQRFWLIGILSAMVGVALALL
jgi:phospho-N-acetylmuramoyl-pentapeptide-transferase